MPVSVSTSLENIEVMEGKNHFRGRFARVLFSSCIGPPKTLSKDREDSHWDSISGKFVSISLFDTVFPQNGSSRGIANIFQGHFCHP